MKVLIVENNPITRLAYEEQIKSLGHEAASCAAVETALETYQQIYYPLIILDLELPGIMTGFEFIRYIRALPQGSRSMILVMLAQAQIEALQAVLEAGANDFLIKPVSKEVLRGRLMVIERQIRNRVQYKQTEEDLEIHHTHLKKLVEKRTTELHRLNEQLTRKLTEHNQVERSLKESEEWLTAILKGIGDGVIVTDNTGKITFINPVGETLTGWKLEEILGREIAFNIIDEETRTPIENPLQEALREDIVISLAHYPLLVTRDGAEIPVEYRGAPIKDDKGNVTGVVLVLHDITTRKQVEETLSQLKKAVETIQLGVTITDTKGKIIYTNPAEARMHGYRVDNLLGKDLGIFAPPKLRNPMPLEDLREIGTMDRESVNIRKDGSLFPVRLISDVVKDAKNTPIAIVTICEDITERKRAEQALREREQQYRFLAENVADGVAIFQEGRLVFSNEALVSIFGYTTEQLLRIDLFRLLREDYTEIGRKKFALMEQGIGDPYWQAPCVTEEGREIWVETRHSLINWEGKPAILLTMRDITTSKLQEIAIKEEKEHLWRENITLKSTIKDRYRFGDIIGKSQPMQEVYELLLKGAASDANVLIHGESGTGKELIARTIHRLSKRHTQAFIPVNCGAIPDPLFESELFGYRKGAFTGAYRDKSGLFDAAHKGTLFLDEVGELSPAMQVKLLRVLESGEFTRVGDNAVRKVNVRVVTATNRDLEQLTEEGLLRRDFFYRIHVMVINVPPLRERKEDLSLLVDHFLEYYTDGKTRQTLPGEILKDLYTYDWPGNVRELQNVLQRYLAGQPLTFASVYKTLSASGDHIARAAAGHESLVLQEAVEEFEKQFILSMLEQNRWHKSNTASKLGIDRKTLFRKMKKFGLS